MSFSKPQKRDRFVQDGSRGFTTPPAKIHGSPAESAMKSGNYNPVEIYASNHAVSVAAAQMTEHIEKLSHAGLIGAEEAQHRIATIEEVRALTNANVGADMSDFESENAITAEEKKLALERKWKEEAGDTDSAAPHSKSQPQRRPSNVQPCSRTQGGE